MSIAAAVPLPYRPALVLPEPSLTHLSNEPTTNAELSGVGLTSFFKLRHRRAVKMLVKMRQMFPPVYVARGVW